MSDVPPQAHPSTTRYRSVVEGVELANDFARSRLTLSEFARQRGVTLRMVKYWSTRARQLAATTASADLVQVAEVAASGTIESVPGPLLLAAPTPVPGPAAQGASPPPTIEVRLPNGVRIGIAAGFSPAVLTQVLACLSGKPC